MSGLGESDVAGPCSPQPLQADIGAPKSACRPPANLPSTRIRARIIAPVTPLPPSPVLAPSIGGFGLNGLQPFGRGSPLVRQRNDNVEPGITTYHPSGVSSARKVFSQQDIPWGYSFHCAVTGFYLYLASYVDSILAPGSVVPVEEIPRWRASESYAGRTFQRCALAVRALSVNERLEREGNLLHMRQPVVPRIYPENGWYSTSMRESIRGGRNIEWSCRSSGAAHDLKHRRNGPPQSLDGQGWFCPPGKQVRIEGVDREGQQTVVPHEHSQFHQSSDAKL